MSAFPDEFAFCGTWRSYQARVIDELADHLHDSRLHVIAAPGSGKTVLGLEVIRRLGRPVLVLAPTLTIRDQWVERLSQLFLGGSRIPAWVSRDLGEPNLFTVATYQALHGAYAEEDEAGEEAAEEWDGGDRADAEAAPTVAQRAARRFDLLERLRGAGIRAVVVDEAHHLRSEWWKSLTEVVAALDQATVVALTATPPYDVAPFEWARYETLCGPVDAEVSVPELVAQGDLCPHQDYVCFSAPTPDEARRLGDFRRHVEEFRTALERDERLIAALQSHPWMRDPRTHVEDMLADPAYVSSMAVFLTHARRAMHPELLALLGVKGKKLPALDLEWLEILLTGCLYRDAASYAAHQPLLRELGQRLRAIGALERRKVVLRNPTAASRLLTASINKLHSITDIVRLETGALGERLRAVVLADHIRRSEMPTRPGEASEFERLGVVPIFETLRRESMPGVRLGILSGSLVVIPREAAPALRDIAREAGIAVEDLSVRPLDHEEAFCAVEVRRTGNAGVVRLVTGLFTQGDVNVLVGTKSLLGEGWDAPSINCLVLASVVGSYMLSNQMRGRAIRTDPAHPDKTANIWHLATVEPDQPPGDDYDTLARRFRAFTGVAYDRPVIENGFGRLALGDPPFSREGIARINDATRRKALDRAALAAAWREGLAGGVRLVEAVEAPAERGLRRLVFSNTLAALLWQGGMLGLYFFAQSARGLRRVAPERALTYLAWAVGVGVLVALPRFLKAAWLFLRHGTLESSIKEVGEALLATLVKIGAVETPRHGLSVHVGKGDMGTVKCSLNGGTSYESSLFLTALREMLDPIENPRYLLVRRTGIWWGFREDYHAVPELIGRRKDQAEHLGKMWRRHVGPATLVYTRATEGRRALLRARAHSLATAFQRRTDRLSCWQ